MELKCKTKNSSVLHHVTINRQFPIHEQMGMTNVAKTCIVPVAFFHYNYPEKPTCLASSSASTWRLEPWNTCTDSDLDTTWIAICSSQLEIIERGQTIRVPPSIGPVRSRDLFSDPSISAIVVTVF